MGACGLAWARVALVAQLGVWVELVLGGTELVLEDCMWVGVG